MDTPDYQSLTPNTIIAAIESVGLMPDARILALNSYENRVYQVGIEDESPIIAKFYRPNRWSNEQILEEHQFTQHLAKQELSVIAPTSLDNNTLFHFQGFRFAIYPRQGGHTPILEKKEHLQSIGRLLARIHACAKIMPFQHRPTISVEEFGQASINFLLDGQWLPSYLLPAYISLTDELLELCHKHFEKITSPFISLQGDCHPGNLLWRDDKAYLIDFDDARRGPAIHDLWMLLSGDEHEQRQQLDHLLDGYQDFFDFNYQETLLIECLRTLRIIHYSAWLAKRWNDPSFPLNFPWFNTERYWSEHILALREQLAAMQAVSI